MASTLPKKKGKIDPRLKNSKRANRNQTDYSGNHWPKTRLDYEVMEKAKILVDTVEYIRRERKRKPEAGPWVKEIRVSILPWSRSGYMDIRFYIKGQSTGRGILCHIDK